MRSQYGVPCSGQVTLWVDKEKLTTVTREYDRVSMQGIRRSVLHAQARATGLPLLEAMIPAQCSNTDYEHAMADAIARARDRWPGLRTMAFGMTGTLVPLTVTLAVPLLGSTAGFQLLATFQYA